MNATYDAERAEALESYDVFDKDIEAELEGLTELASKICDTPISLLNLLDSSYQQSKATKGWNIDGMPREDSFCQYSILDKDLFIVEDAEKDRRFKNSPYVKGDPHIRFYAGAPLRTKEGYNIGALCVIDREPRQLNSSQRESLKLLANEAMARLELIKNKNELSKRNAELEKQKVFVNNSSDIQMIIDAGSLKILEINDRALKLLGGSRQQFINKEFGSRFVHDQKKELVQSFLRNEKDLRRTFLCKTVSESGDQIFHFENTFKYRQGAWFVTGRDVTTRVQAEQKLDKERDLSDKIINSLPVFFFMYDRQGNILRWNNRMQNKTGYSDFELSYKNPADFFGEDRELVAAKITEVFETGEATIEARFLNKDGTSAPYLFNATLFEESGQKFMIGTGQDISKLKAYQEEIKQSLREKEVLLAEVHHRVKNNLAVISGLLQLQALNSDDEVLTNQLTNSQSRIQSIAAIHELLYQSNSLSEIQLDDEIARLAQNAEKVNPSATDINLDLETTSIKINVNQAVPLALILNELFTNSYKHAFENQEKGTITLEIEEEDEDKLLKITLTDDGIGLPDTFSTEQPESLGLKIISVLSNQLDADLTFNSNENGTQVTLQFQKVQKKGSASGVID